MMTPPPGPSPAAAAAAATYFGVGHTKFQMLNAQAAGYSMVIVYDSMQGNMFKMGGSSGKGSQQPEVEIPSVSVPIHGDPANGEAVSDGVPVPAPVPACVPRVFDMTHGLPGDFGCTSRAISYVSMGNY